MRGGVDIDQSPFRQRGFVVAAGFVGLMVVAGVVVVVAHFLGGASVRAGVRLDASSRALAASAQVGKAPARRTLRRKAPAFGGTCPPLPGGSQQVPTSTPVGSAWALVGGMAEPSAPSTIGPARQVDGFGECYAHSPLGALYAAENVWVAFSVRPQSRVMLALAVADHARDVAVEQAVMGDNRDLQRLVNGSLALTGFAFSSYSPRDADITVVIQGTPGGQAAIPMAMRWVGDDWKFLVPPGGQDFAAAEPTDMDGFVAWSAG